MTEYGAAVERGSVTEVCEDGYRVSSYTRKGVVTPPIPAVGNTAYADGDNVYFFIFDNGHGLIIAAF